MELKTSFSNGEKISVHTEELSRLVCPLCYEYMRPPIFECQNRHGICDLCHDLLSECPICQSFLPYRRSSYLETLTTLVLFPCKQCKQVFSLDELDKHQCKDQGKTTYCLIGQVYGDCTWTGLPQDMVEHCRVNHPKNYWTKRENCAQWLYSRLSNIGIQNAYILDLTDAVFVIVQKFDSETRSLQWNISGECDKYLEQYVYEIQLFLDEDTVTYRKEIDIDRNIMTFLPNDNEIVIPVERVADFLSTDNFVQYKVLIHKKIEITSNTINVKYYPSKVEIVDNVDAIEKVNCIQKTKGSFTYFYKRIRSCFC